MGTNKKIPREKVQKIIIENQEEDRIKFLDSLGNEDLGNDNFEEKRTTDISSTGDGTNPLTGLDY